MDDFYDYFDVFWLLPGGGLALLVAGIVLLVMSRSADPDKKRTLKGSAGRCWDVAAAWSRSRW
jgi:hypothetical protein